MKSRYPDDSRIPRSRVIAFFLCLFLGNLGFHRFYVGKIGSGLLYLCTFGVCGLGWIMDLVSIIFGVFTDYKGRPLGKQRTAGKAILADILISIISIPDLIFDCLDSLTLAFCDTIPFLGFLWFL